MTSQLMPIYKANDLLQDSILIGVFNRTMQLKEDTLQEIHYQSLSMHKCIIQQEIDYYEQLGYIILYITSEDQFWFSLDDPNIIFWCKLHFIQEHQDISYLTLLQKYLKKCQQLVQPINKKEHNELLSMALDIIHQYSESH